MLVKLKPITPGQRGTVKVVLDVYKGAPVKSLVESSKKRSSGRNNNGRITVRHKGGGTRSKYRLIDFKRSSKDGVKSVVERIEYDPNRTALIALLKYVDGSRSYIVATKNMKAGDEVLTGLEAPIASGNSLPIRSIPVGTTICMIEQFPGKGAQMVRSAGGSAQILGKEGVNAQIRLKSGEVRLVHIDCRATVGEVSNQENSLRKLGKAGAKRWRGVRPTVRGVAMNPVDHPHGGGEGRTGEGRAPVSPWGVLAKGYRTRNSRRTDRMIVQSRHKR